MRTPDFKNVLFSLLPPGVCFRANAIRLDGLLTNMASPFRTIEDRAFQAVGEIPGHLQTNTPEWERITGLPDTGCQQNIAPDQNAIVTRLLATGGQSISYLESVANNASSHPDKPITIRRLGPLRFAVDGVDIKRKFFRAGSRAGDRVQDFKRDERVICEIGRIRHAHVKAYYYDTENQDA